MKISRDVAIAVLKHLYKHPKCSFPFLVMCKEYSQEDDDFVEVQPNEWKNIKSDQIYQTFEIREYLQNKNKLKNKSKAKNLIRKIIIKSIYKTIQWMANGYKNLYKSELTESESITEYWENEFYWWKLEAYKDILYLLKKYKFKI